MLTRRPGRRGHQSLPSTSRLRAAIDIGHELSTIGYALVERFVFEANTEAPSSSRVGKPVGKSTPAAQERCAEAGATTGGWSAEFADRFAGP